MILLFYGWMYYLATSISDDEIYKLTILSNDSSTYRLITKPFLTLGIFTHKLLNLVRFIGSRHRYINA